MKESPYTLRQQDLLGISRTYLSPGARPRNGGIAHGPSGHSKDSQIRQLSQVSSRTGKYIGKNG